MHIGIITVRSAAYHPNRRLRQAAEARGFRLSLVHPYETWPAIQDGAVTLRGRLQPLDAVLPRQGATVADACLPLIRHFSLLGIPVVNGLEAVSLTRNQFLTLQVLAQAGLPVPDTWFVNSVQGLERARRALGGAPVVVKRVSGRQGSGVHLLERGTLSVEFARRFLQKRKGLVVQRFVPPAGRQDIRIVVVGDQVAGAMRLKPRAGDFRANYHLSRTSEPLDPPSQWVRLALEAVRVTGLEIGGVDLMVEPGGRALLVEVNYAPGFRGLERSTGLDIAGRIVDYVAERCGGGRQSPRRGGASAADGV